MLGANDDNTAMSVLTICYAIIEGRELSTVWSTLSYLSISLSLNIILTLMIVVRLILQGRNVHATTGSPGGIMLIESSALFAVSSLSVIVPLAAGSLVTELLYSILAQTQVRALA